MIRCSPTCPDLGWNPQPLVYRTILQWTEPPGQDGQYNSYFFIAGLEYFSLLLLKTSSSEVHSVLHISSPLNFVAIFTAVQMYLDDFITCFLSQMILCLCIRCFYHWFWWLICHPGTIVSWLPLLQWLTIKKLPSIKSPQSLPWIINNSWIIFLCSSFNYPTFSTFPSVLRFFDSLLSLWPLILHHLLIFLVFFFLHLLGPSTGLETGDLS